jgi:probable rRNA maturation factor
MRRPRKRRARRRLTARRAENPARSLRVPVLPTALRLSLQQPCDLHRGLLTRHFVARCLRAALQGQAAELTVRIVDADEGLALNQGFRRKAYATNVLTFDYAREPVVQADLVLCAPVVASEAQAQGLSLEAHYAHLLLHGTLHALGHDHQRAPQARKMEGLEAELMQLLGYADPYAKPCANPAFAAAAPKEGSQAQAAVARRRRATKPTAPRPAKSIA